MNKIKLITCSLFFAQICFASEDAGLLFNVTGSSSSVTVSTVATNHTYPAAGIKIKTPGYQLSGVGSECTMANTEYCLFSVSDTAPKTFSITGSGNALEITLCLNGNGPLSCQDYMIGTGAGRVANAVYVVNANVNFMANSSDYILLCPLDPSSQQFDFASCGSAFDPSSSFTDSFVQSIALNDAGDTAYLSVFAATYFYQCEVDTTTQLLNNCNQVNFNLPSFETFAGLIALYPTGGSSGNYGYFIDFTDSTVAACSITDENMSGDNCVILNMSIDEFAVGIAFNQIDGQDYIYVGNSSASEVTVCPLTSPTSVGSCNNITGGGAVTFTDPSGLAFHPTNHLLYIADSAGQVYACDSSQISGPAFTNCQTASSMTADAWAIAFNSDGTMAYITSNGAGSVYECPINQTDGITFDSCNTQSGFVQSVGLALGYK